MMNTERNSLAAHRQPGTPRWIVRGFAICSLLVALLVAATDARAQSGVLVPSSQSDEPDSSVLELTEMTVSVTIDRQLARTRVLQIFANRTERAVEGTYVFAIPTTASIADFAVWDGDTRIPGVILEKRRAKSLYDEIAAQAIDPGLLEQEDENQSATAFTVQVAPVPAYGTKRLELEYTEMLPIDDLRSYYSFPLKPSEYGEQMIGHLRIDVRILSGFPIGDLESRGTQFPFTMDREESGALVAHFEETRIQPAQDFSFTYSIAAPRSQLDVIAYRSPERIVPSELRNPALAERQPDGYFQASAVFNGGGRAPGAASPNTKPRSVLIMLDTSLSMSGEKLERGYEAVQYFLSALTPNDHFNLVLFNDDVLAFSEKPVAGSADQTERALNFVRASYLSGGTDLESSLSRAAELAAQLPEVDGGRAIVMITDGNSTLTTTQTRRIVDTFSGANNRGVKARLNVFGIGIDTRIGLLGELAKASRGLFVWARETEDLEFKLKAFFAKVGQIPIDDLTLSVSAGDVYQVYPDGGTVAFDGSSAVFLGRYKKPGAAEFKVAGKSEQGPVELTGSIELPERDATHGEVPRLWARARVDYLLSQIELNGETDAAIDEIIALSKRYKFVTPYTSFLAAPRSLLRPRVIRPGDPVLRVKTDPSITSVVAVFPFGLVKPMRFLEKEGVWETRFLAPRDMDDGSYSCRLVLTDAIGRSYEEVKRFRIDSRPPALNVTVGPQQVKAGSDVVVSVRADKDARWIAARLFGSAPVKVEWNAEAKSNIGRLHIPDGLPAGKYTVYVTAEDFARNGAATEVEIEVLGR